MVSDLASGFLTSDLVFSGYLTSLFGSSFFDSESIYFS
jgi:hypothetical protein